MRVRLFRKLFRTANAYRLYLLIGNESLLLPKRYREIDLRKSVNSTNEFHYITKTQRP